MKVKIRSFYIYDNNRMGRISCDPQQYDDYLEEDLDATITTTDAQITIKHLQGNIIIEENKITQVRNGNTIIIEEGKTNTCTYNTEHGAIELKVDGISIERFDNGEIICRATYLISTNGTKPYKTVVEIIANP